LIDFKKLGWSFPKQLVLLLADTIIEMQPDFEEFKIWRNAYNNIEYDLDKEIVKPFNGFTLGMHDNMASFIISCLWLIAEEKLKQNDIDLTKVRARFKGDDSYIRVEDTWDVTNFIYVTWINLIRSYNMLLSHKKTIITKHCGIYLEKYGIHPTIQTQKRFKYILNIFNTLKCYNIAHAKEYLAGIVDSLNNTILIQDDIFRKMMDEAINQVIAIWGFEFFPNEYLLPFEFGGWLRFKDNGLNQCIIWLEENYQIDDNLLGLPFANKTKRQYFHNYSKKKVKNVQQDLHIKELFAFSKSRGINLEEFVFQKYAFEKDVSRIYQNIDYWKRVAHERLNVKYVREPWYLYCDHFFLKSGLKSLALPMSGVHVFEENSEPTFNWIPNMKINIDHNKLGIFRYIALLHEMASGKPNPFRIKLLHKLKLGDIVYGLNRWIYSAGYAYPIQYIGWAMDNSCDLYQLEKSLNNLGIASIASTYTKYYNPDDVSKYFFTHQIPKGTDVVMCDWYTGMPVYFDSATFPKKFGSRTAKCDYIFHQRCIQHGNSDDFRITSKEDIIKAYWCEPSAKILCEKLKPEISTVYIPPEEKKFTGAIFFDSSDESSSGSGKIPETIEFIDEMESISIDEEMITDYQDDPNIIMDDPTIVDSIELSDDLDDNMVEQYYNENLQDLDDFEVNVQEGSSEDPLDKYFSDSVSEE